MIQYFVPLLLLLCLACVRPVAGRDEECSWKPDIEWTGLTADQVIERAKTTGLNWTIYENFAEGSIGCGQSLTSTEIILQDGKSVLVRGCCYSRGKKPRITPWFDCHGSAKKTNSKVSRGNILRSLSYGVDTDEYRKDVLERVAKNWHPLMPYKSLVVSVEIDNLGHIVPRDLKVTTSSGNKQLDEQALNAFKTTRFAPLHEENWGFCDSIDMLEVNNYIGHTH